MVNYGNYVNFFPKRLGRWQRPETRRLLPWWRSVIQRRTNFPSRYGKSFRPWRKSIPHRAEKVSVVVRKKWKERFCFHINYSSFASSACSVDRRSMKEIEEDRRQYLYPFAPINTLNHMSSISLLLLLSPSYSFASAACESTSPVPHRCCGMMSFFSYLCSVFYRVFVKKPLQ